MKRKLKPATAYSNHQFGLFRFEETRPKLKVPISKARVEEVKRLIELGDGDKALKVLREIRYGLENFLNRLK